MRNILVLGAGKSAYHLIQYLLTNSQKENWMVTVGDVSKEAALEKTQNHPSSKAITFDINNEEIRKTEIANADIVISLLPPTLHYIAATECLTQSKNLVTASYVSPQMLALHPDVTGKGLLFLNECGLDPGLDHMSAMEIIDALKNQGAEITSFKSFTGGLIAPESNNNPWGYKFTWNPKNVILAGQGTARCIINGAYKYIPYSRVFTQTEKIQIDGLGVLEGYANRDSLQYRELYNIPNVPTLLRGTLRYEGFCSAWNILVQLGLTDDSYKIENSSSITYHDLMQSLMCSNTELTKHNLEKFLSLNQISDMDYERIKWTGLFDQKTIKVSNSSPAEILLDLLLDKWRLEENDIDLVAMQHLITFEQNGHEKTIKSTLVVKGESQKATAMSKTVGLPLAIAAKNILNNRINVSGVKIPTEKQIYNPILTELKTHNIFFLEHIT